MSFPDNYLKMLILERVPADGTAIGNQSLFAALRAEEPQLTESEFREARDVLISQGELARGRGRGGSVFRVTKTHLVMSEQEEADFKYGDDGDDGEEDEEDDEGGFAEGDAGDFELVAQRLPSGDIEVRPRKRRAAAREAAPHILSYRHSDKRANNPEISIVHPDNDPDRPKTLWRYDPHLDPSLQFDGTRARVEDLIDGALAAGDVEQMREALIELRRLQEPYLNWSGKAERTNFDVDTVSLYVHERIDPASILSALRKGEKNSADKTFQPDLFSAPFENLPLRKALDFYKHEKNS